MPHGGTTKTRIEDDKSGNDKVLIEIDAIIARVHETTVEIRFIPNDVIAQFPSVMFADKSLLKYAQPITFQIRLSHSGKKYPMFISRIDNCVNHKRDAIIKMLDDIEI